MANPIPHVPTPNNVTIRYTTPQDSEWLMKWLLDPAVRNCFPMINAAEVDDATRRWISFSRLKAALTVEVSGRPAGIAALYLQGYLRLIHQTDFGIIVAPEYRGQGIGSFLLSSIMKLAKHMKIELLHLQVQDGNPAIHLYSRFGFTEFGRQEHWIKDDTGYIARIFMEREL